MAEINVVSNGALIVEFNCKTTLPLPVGDCHETPYGAPVSDFRNVPFEPALTVPHPDPFDAIVCPKALPVAVTVYPVPNAFVPIKLFGVFE